MAGRIEAAIRESAGLVSATPAPDKATDEAAGKAAGEAMPAAANGE